MTEDFNICDNFWDPNYPFHSSNRNLLIDLVNSINLGLFFNTNSISTRYSNNDYDSNSVIDLMSLRYESDEPDSYSIHLDQRLVSNHAPLTICIPIFGELITTKKQTLVKDSDKEKQFISILINHICKINTSTISNITSLEYSIQSIAQAMEKLQLQNAKTVNITRKSKSWWDNNYSRDLEQYRSSRHIEDWKKIQKHSQTNKKNLF